MKHYLKIRIITSKKTNTLLKLNKINVDTRNIIYEKDSLVLEILSSDLKRVKKYLISYKIEIIDETGIYKIKKELRKNMLFIVSIMIVNVRVEERIINNYEEESGFCHIVASKSGIVKSISTKKGVSLVNINDYVSSGEILISGEIKLNEEVKKALNNMINLDEIASVRLTNDYNFTDTETKQYRYQCIYDIVNYK